MYVMRSSKTMSELKIKKSFRFHCMCHIYIYIWLNITIDTVPEIQPKVQLWNASHRTSLLFSLLQKKKNLFKFKIIMVDAQQQRENEHAPLFSHFKLVKLCIMIGGDLFLIVTHFVSTLCPIFTHNDNGILHPINMCGTPTHPHTLRQHPTPTARARAELWLVFTHSMAKTLAWLSFLSSIIYHKIQRFTNVFKIQT